MDRTQELRKIPFQMQISLSDLEQSRRNAEVATWYRKHTGSVMVVWRPKRFGKEQMRSTGLDMRVRSGSG